MNTYEEKQANRKARFQELAEKAAREASATITEARRRSECIPMGQPILIGHHSEGRDRNFRAGIHRLYGKAFALDNKATHYANKADSVGACGISSDDPDALEKLRAELADVLASQEAMKAVNKALRANKTSEARIAALISLGYDQHKAEELASPDFCGRIGFPRYALSNNNSNARRIELRIKELEARRARSDVEIEGTGYTYREDVEDNRVQLIFPGKPSDELRQLLKRHAFKWSPTRGAWVRQLNNAGIYAAQYIRQHLDAAGANG